MEQTRQEYLIRYLEYLCNANVTSRKLGESMKYVAHFLEHAESISRKGYQQYRLNFASDMALAPGYSDCVLDFLTFLGVGYNRKKRQVKAQEKKSVVSERNRNKLDAFANWLSQEFDFSHSTQASYVTGMKLFYQYADDFNTENVKRYLKTMEDQGKKANTINLRISGFEKFAEFAKKPISVKRRKHKRTLSVENVPTEKEYEALLAYLKTKPNKDYYFFVRILATTGARLHEFMKFTWEDIVHGEVVLKGKGSKYRRFFFQKELQREVKDYVKETGKKGLICLNRYGQTMNQRGFSENLKDWGKHVGIDSKKMHAHAFRHFFAKMYLKKNKDIVQLADLLGHGSIDTTRIYLQKSYDEQQRDFNRNVTW